MPWVCALAIFPHMGVWLCPLLPSDTDSAVASVKSFLTTLLTVATLVQSSFLVVLGTYYPLTSLLCNFIYLPTSSLTNVYREFLGFF